MELHFRNRTLAVGKIPAIMGILNVTPDSFSDGGSSIPLADRIAALIHDGAQIIDIGGESTRPGAEEISSAEELSRVLPAVKLIRSNAPEMVISVDTRKSTVARAALECGTDIINDVSGLRFDPAMAGVIAEYKAGAILMHSRALPENMQNTEFTKYRNGLLETVRSELLFSVEKALGAGVPRENIILDPGIGFAKTAGQSAELIRGGSFLVGIGYPLLSGPSRKSFIGKIINEPDPVLRDFGTCGALIASMLSGYTILRVHNVKGALDALKVFQDCH